MARLDDREGLNRSIMAGDIDRHPVGRTLTPEARERAITFATGAWKGQTGAGTAADLGVQHVISDVIRKD